MKHLKFNLYRFRTIVLKRYKFSRVSGGGWQALYSGLTNYLIFGSI